MADGINVTPGTGKTVATDEVTDGTLGTVQVQYVKLMDGTLDGTTKAAVGANGLAADVKAVVPGTAATSLGKAEDAAHSSGDTGVMLLAVRKDTAAALAGSDGDYAPLEVDANGSLHATVAGTVTANKATRTLTWATGTAASSGHNSIVGAPGASTRIVVKYLMAQNESATATTAIWEDDTTAKIRSYHAAVGNGSIWQFEDGSEWRLTANKALQLNLSGANSHGYTVGYWTEAA